LGLANIKRDPKREFGKKTTETLKYTAPERCCVGWEKRGENPYKLFCLSAPGKKKKNFWAPPPEKLAPPIERKRKPPHPKVLGGQTVW